MPITVNDSCEKTTVFLHAPSTLCSPSPPACLRFTILVQQNNVREIHADMSQANCSHRIWVQPDVLGLFSVGVGSFSDNLGLRAIIFSDNVGRKLRYSRAERFMLSGRYSYGESIAMDPQGYSRLWAVDEN
jgi:hypothetical protein